MYFYFLRIQRDTKELTALYCNMEARVVRNRNISMGELWIMFTLDAFNAVIGTAPGRGRGGIYCTCTHTHTHVCAQRSAKSYGCVFAHCTASDVKELGIKSTSPRKVRHAGKLMLASMRCDQSWALLVFLNFSNKKMIFCHFLSS